MGFGLGEVHRLLHTVLDVDVHTKHVRAALTPIGGAVCRHNIAPPFIIKLWREARALVRLIATAPVG